ncbi:uncharacterized protein LOC124436067 [Xenia sp. Carnegie-2017]|uniref:uncharacterized protein LOC124436067 n=1 Tax=Xenia sp. Carnegie-2017 TaxID=2897299 RepID=UPI001F04D894|nr:uncharacterized protein LOC124436067 [Xenia sp. Carnegie-2017]
MYATVQTAISQENDKSLNELKLRLNEEYCGATKMSREEFLSLLLKDETSLSREFSAEIYIPKIVRKQHEDKGNVCMALRSEVSGNCLYSSVSLLLAVFFPSKTKRTISGPTCPVPSKSKAEKSLGISVSFFKMENQKSLQVRFLVLGLLNKPLKIYR